jgi:hypothetical protein
MTNDAKLGLVLGIGVVILIAIVFFRRDPVLAATVPESPSAVAVAPVAPPGPNDPEPGTPESPR